MKKAYKMGENIAKVFSNDYLWIRMISIFFYIFFCILDISYHLYIYYFHDQEGIEPFKKKFKHFSYNNYFNLLFKEDFPTAFNFHI